jgi:hypothetical protein
MSHQKTYRVVVACALLVYFRKDGSRVPVMVGSALFEGGNKGVVFALDFERTKARRGGPPEQRSVLGGSAEAEPNWQLGLERCDR